MIEPMKFVSISGPRDDLDRMVNRSYAGMRSIWKMP